MVDNGWKFSRSYFQPPPYTGDCRSDAVVTRRYFSVRFLGGPGLGRLYTVAVPCVYPLCTMCTLGVRAGKTLMSGLVIQEYCVT